MLKTSPPDVDEVSELIKFLRACFLDRTLPVFTRLCGIHPILNYQRRISKLEVADVEVCLGSHWPQRVQQPHLQVGGQVLELVGPVVRQLVIPRQVGYPEVTLQSILN